MNTKAPPLLVLLAILLSVIAVIGILTRGGDPERPDGAGKAAPPSGTSGDPGRTVDGGAIRGVVLGHADRPVEGARVVLLPETSDIAPRIAAELPARVREALLHAARTAGRPLRLEDTGKDVDDADAVAEAQTGPDGTFRFDVALGRRYAVQATSKGLLSQPNGRLRGGDEVTLRLARATTLRGVVTGEGGAPLAGARIDVPGVPAAVTGAAGIFDLGGVPPGPTVVRIRHDGYATLRDPVLVPRDGLERTFQLERGIALDVLIKQQDGNVARPAVGAAVFLVAVSSGELRRADTGADGRAHIGCLSAGPHDLVAWLEDCPPAVRAGLLLTADRSIELVLAKVSSRAIRVLGPDGDPVGGARFLLADADGALDPTSPREVGRAGPDGVFRFAFDDADRSVLWVTASGMAAAQVAPIDPTATDEIVVRMRPGGGTLRGRVVDYDSRPIARARVTLEQPGPADEAVVLSLVTDGDGNFVAEGLAGRGVRVEVRVEGYLTEGVFLDELEPKLSLQIVMRRGDDLRGHVVDAGGNAMASVVVTLAGESAVRTTTGPDGSWRLSGLPPELRGRPVALLLEHGGLAWAAAVSAGGETKIQKPASVVLRGRVLADESGAPVDAFGLYVVSGGRQIQSRRVADGQGAFEVIVPDEPGVELQVFAQGRTRWSQPLAEVQEADRAALEVRLAPPSRLVVLVLTPEGTPVKDARVIVQRSGQTWASTARTGDDGQATVIDEPGEVRLLVTHHARAGAVVPSVRLARGEATREEVRLGAAVAARITVRGPAGLLLIGTPPRLARTVDIAMGRERCILTGETEHGALRIEISGPGTMVLRYERPRVEGGALVLPGLPLGKYQVTVLLGSKASESTPFEVRGGATEEVVLDAGR